MIKKYLLLCLITFLSFSCSNSANYDSALNESSVGNLSFKDINNIKESKSCITGSISIFRSYYRFISDYLFMNKLFQTQSEKYENIIGKLSDLEGDASTLTAAKLGGITEIKMVDHSYEIAGIFKRRYCVVVYGE